MGTVLSETVYVSESGQEAVAEEVFDLIDRLEKETLSAKVETSELGLLNAGAGGGESCAVSEELYEYLRMTLEVSEKSDGALDPSIAPVSRLWDFGGENERVPSEQEIAAALASVGYEEVVLTEDCSVLLCEGMALELGAVGKGIACDVVAAYLKEQGDMVTGAVVSVGGSVVTYGEKPVLGGTVQPWKIAIANPENSTEYVGYVEVLGEHYISTSGSYEKNITAEDGTVYHHILDPETGYSAVRQPEIVSVTAIADSGLLADALSTACFVLEREEAFALAGNYGAELILITDSGELIMTEGAEALFHEL